jgi:hypothetical protein
MIIKSKSYKAIIQYNPSNVGSYRNWFYSVAPNTRAEDVHVSIFDQTDKLVD